MPEVLTEPFDKEAVLDTEIQPLLDEISKVCRAHGIPFFTVFVYGKEGDDLKLCTSLQYCGRGGVERLQLAANLLLTGDPETALVQEPRSDRAKTEWCGAVSPSRDAICGYAKGHDGRCAWDQAVGSGSASKELKS